MSQSETVKSEKGTCFVALYSTDIHYEVCCRIPRKNGKGWLRAAMGGHHANEASKEFMSWVVYGSSGGRGLDVRDCDGYTVIESREMLIPATIVTEILNKLSEIFPHVSEWQKAPFEIVAATNEQICNFLTKLKSENE